MMFQEYEEGNVNLQLNNLNNTSNSQIIASESEHKRKNKTNIINVPRLVKMGNWINPYL